MGGKNGCVQMGPLTHPCIRCTSKWINSGLGGCAGCTGDSVTCHVISQLPQALCKPATALLAVLTGTIALYNSKLFSGIWDGICMKSCFVIRLGLLVPASLLSFLQTGLQHPRFVPTLPLYPSSCQVLLVAFWSANLQSWPLCFWDIILYTQAHVISVAVISACDSCFFK